jgi:hypothetical protein
MARLAQPVHADLSSVMEQRADLSSVMAQRARSPDHAVDEEESQQPTVSAASSSTAFLNMFRDSRGASPALFRDFDAGAAPGAD